MKYLSRAVVVLAALVAAGQVRAADKEGKGEAEGLNEAIVNANTKIYEAGRAFGDTLAPALKEKKVDIIDLKRDYKRIQKVLEIVQGDLKDAKVPDSKTARDYYKAHQAFLKVQEGFIKKEFAEIIRVMEDDDLTAGDKKKKIEAISKQMAAAEKKIFAELQKAQKAFAKEFGIKIE